VYPSPIVKKREKQHNPWLANMDTGIGGQFIVFGGFIPFIDLQQIFYITTAVTLIRE
jgi:hypothetical protein